MPLSGPGRLPGEATFNIKDGFLEAICRGYRSRLLEQSDYNNLCQCETLEDLKLHLVSTEYRTYLQNDPTIEINKLHEKLRLKLVHEFQYMRANASEPLATFLDFITTGYMIDNVTLMLSGAQQDRSAAEMMEKCHPLGLFDASTSRNILQASSLALSPADLYEMVLVDTPLARYFTANLLTDRDLNESNINIIRASLFRSYLEDFHNFCTRELGGTTGETMGKILQFEADRRAVEITINTKDTELDKPDDRARLFCKFGTLYPEGLKKLARADSDEAVRAAVEPYAYSQVFAQGQGQDGGERSLSNAFYELEVALHKDSFQQMFHYGIFYSIVRLKEQEIRNIVWIAESILQNQRDRIREFVPLF